MQDSVPTPKPGAPIQTPAPTPTAAPTPATDTTTPDTSGEPMSLIDRMGVVMSMLGGGSGGPNVGGVDTSTTGLASENPIAFNNSDEDTGNDTSQVAPGDAHASADGRPVTDATAGAVLHSDNAANKTLAQQKAAKLGWDSGAEWTALNNVVMSESGWSSTVQNPNGTAAGIAQNIHGFSDSYQKGNADQQIDWLLSYIKSRYGDPIAAWQHKLDTKGQYGNKGGWY